MRTITVAAMLMVFGLLGLVTNALAAVAIDSVSTPNVSSECSNGGASTDCSSTHDGMTFSHTVSGTNRLLLVFAQGEGDQTDPDVNTVTYAGQPLTPQLVAGPTRGVYVQIWSLLNPPIGTADVILAYGGTSDNSGAAAVSLTGVDQSTPLGGQNSDLSTGSTSTSLLTLTTTYADSMIVAAHTGDGADTAPYTPTTTSDTLNELWDFTSGGGSGFSDTGYAGGNLLATTTSLYSFGWDQSVSDDFAIAAIEVVPVQDSTAPSSVGPVTITIPASGTGTFIPTAVTFTAAVVEPDSTPTCEFTSNGSTWIAGTISGGASPYTCTASPAGLTGAVTLNMRASSAGGGPTTATALNRTVDATGPTDGVLTITPGNAQNTLTLTAAVDAGIGLRTTNAYDVRFLTGATPPTCATGTSWYTGTSTTIPVHTGLTNGTQYSYRVCAYDNYNNVSTGATGSGTPVATSIPVLTTPTASNVLQTTATLGATIASNGGAVITSRGTCWGTTVSPVTNCVAEGGTAVAAFAQARTGLTAGTQLYSRGYAVNGVGTGYSPDGSFYTEPGTQATAVNFTSVGTNAMTVNWTAGSGDGVIVLMKADTLVDSPPVDGTWSGYTANTAFGSGTQLGTGNYLVFKGAGSSVTVTGLNPSTTYHVAVYAYKGTVDTAGVNLGVNYRTVTPSIGNQSTTAGCTRVAPTVNFLTGAQSVAPSGSAVYILNITNNDTAGCADTTFNVAVTGDVDTNNAFDAPVLSAVTASIAAGASNTSVTLTVTNNGTGNNGNQSVATVTISDAVNHNGMNQTAVATTTLYNYNPMIHSSLSTASSKWGGKWGTSQVGSKYGEFTCGTCHLKNSVNIKRVKATLASGTADQFPIQAAVGTVTFLDAREGTSDFGDDTPAHSSSSKICEGCHSITNYHRFDTTGQPSLTHYNQSDCIACHKHSEGFKPAGCSGCHGDTVSGQYWPDGLNGNPAYVDDNAGAHGNHVETISQYLGYGDIATLLAAADTATKQKAVCAFCHVDPGGSGHSTDSGDQRVDMVAAGNFSMFTGAGTSGLDAGSNTYNAGNFSCSNLACHNQVTTPTGATSWNNPPAAPTCALCHTGAGASQRHDVHVSDEGYACTQCHTDNGTYPAGTVGLRHGDGLVDLKWDNAGSFENTFGGGTVTYSQSAPLPYKDATWGTCTSAACHNNKTTPAWNAAATNSCSICHSDITADATHNAHTGAAVTYGRIINCVSCHQAATNWSTSTPPASGHINGIFSITNTGSVTPLVYTGVYPTKGSCGTNVCHNDGTNTAAVRAYTWGTPLANDCASCHVATPTTNAHNEHMSNGYTSAACTDCHTAASNANHMGGTINFDVAKATYSLGVSPPVNGPRNGTCATASCHNRSGAQSIAWNVANGTVAGVTDLTCVSCHYYDAAPTAAGNTAHFDPLSTTHNDHFTGGKLCTQCHGTLPTTTAHITVKAGGLVDGATALQDEATLNWADPSAVTDYTLGADNSCYSATNNGLGCHASAGAAGVADATRPDWDVAFASTACTNCHTNTTTTAVNPTSGLHAASPTVSGQAHNQTLTGGCVVCHAGLPNYGTHKDGAFAANGTLAGDRTAMGLFASYTGGTTANNGTGSCSGAGVAAGCHSGVGDNGSWARKWDSSIHYATLVSMTPCAGCHGGFNNDWTFGTVANTTDGSVEHNRNWDGDGTASEVVGNHINNTDKKCNICHVYGDAAYIWGTSHRNNQITMNSTVGYQRTTTTPNYGCTNTCHVSNANHGLENSNWTLQALAGPTLLCTDCHSGSGTGAFKVGASSSHTDPDGPGATYAAGVGNCEACHTDHWTDGMNTIAGRVGLSTIYSRAVVGGGPDTGALAPTMNNQYASHDSYIRLGGAATTAATTEAAMCWGCHDAVTTSQYTLSGVSVTFTNTSATVGTIAATDIGTRFAVGRWITINGSTQIANNRTFRVATSAANSITVTIPAGAGPLATVTNATGVTIVSPISEWGVNQNTVTGDLAYDYGYLYTDTTKPGTMTSNWTAATWRSGKGRLNDAFNPFLYKEGAIQSTHAANYGGTFTAAVSNGNNLGFARTETPDAVANIRCSYCHDVHGTHDGINGDVVGKPFLRGTWKGNPYPEDGAPRTGMANWSREGQNTDYGLVPRGSASRTNSGLATVPNAGGYWIDQNTTNPNSGANSTATAGLCDQCHGTALDGTWTNAELAVINQVTVGNEAANALWVSGYNGHANVVLKGQAADGAGPGRGANASAESYARNIFTRAKRGSNISQNTRVQPTDEVDMGLASVSSERGYSYRDNDGGGFGKFPRIGSGTTTGTGNSQPYAYEWFAWNPIYGSRETATHAISTGTVALQVANITATSDSNLTEAATYDSQANYHTFNCAKCHNPHASRLPKLMITNCLDTNHNNWDNDYANSGTTNVLTVWQNTRLSQWPSAQNCHRLDNRASFGTGVQSRGTGWNKATPWLETATPD